MRQIHHVVVNVADLDRSLVFYRDLLGLRHDGTAPVGGDALSTLVRVPHGSTGRVAFLSAGRGMGRVELVEWEGVAKEVRTDDRPRTGATPGIAILSYLLNEPELRALYERAHADHPCWSAPVTFDVSGRTLVAFVVEDPDGNAVELFSFSDPT